MNADAGATGPLISIVIATRNAAATLPQCLESIRMQSFTNFEVLVQDGDSRDGTLKLLQRDRHLFSYLDSSPDNGVYQAWNRALAHAAGRWICFLGADDRLASPDVLDRYAEVLG